MRFKILALAALAITTIGTLAARPARADDDGWRGDRRGGWHQRWHRDDDDWDRGPRWGVYVPPPPVYYAPPPRVYYAPPPPVVFAPGLSIGIGR